jgi:membrane protein
MAVTDKQWKRIDHLTGDKIRISPFNVQEVVSWILQPTSFLKLLNGAAAVIFDLARMGTGLSVFPPRRDFPEARLPYTVEKSIMKTSGLAKWGEGVSSKFRLFLDALKRFNEDHCFLLSSGVAFALLLCLIPLLLLVLALIGTFLFSDQEVLNHLSGYLKEIFPSLDPKIRKSILKIMQDRRIVGILGIGGLLWTSTWVFSSLGSALNIIFRVERGRSLLRGKAIDLFMLFLAGTLLLMSMALSSVITLLQGYLFEVPLDIGFIFHPILKYLIPFLFTFCMFFLIYKIAPNKRIHSVIALKATLVASILWEVAKQLFGWYILHLGRFSVLYGSLATLAIFLLWIYYTSAIFLLGGEIASLLEQEKSIPADKTRSP